LKQTSWKDVAELFGIGAIVVSLIFVGFQLKQTQEIALAQAYQARSDASANASFAVMQSPEALRAWSMFRKGEQLDFDSPDAIALCRWMVGSFYGMENAFFQYQMGFLPESHWSKVRATIKGIFESAPQMRAACEVDGNMRQEFINEMNQVSEELQAEKAAHE
jgi:hypothetical protein